MQDEDLKLISQIVAGGCRKYTVGDVDRRGYDRLVDLGWLTALRTNDRDVEYHATDSGRAAALQNIDLEKRKPGSRPGSSRPR
jgi:hypothetical protein